MTRWRIRSSIFSLAEMPATFRIRGHTINIHKPRPEFKLHPSFDLMDIIFETESMEDGIHLGLDLSAEAISRISYLSSAPAKIVNTYSVTNPKLTVGENGEIWIPFTYLNRVRVPITAEEFESMDRLSLDSVEMAAIRKFSDGVSNENPFHSFTDLWTSSELLAREEAKKSGIFHEQRCEKCGEIVKRHPKEQSFFVDTLQEISGKDKTQSEVIFQEGRKLRGKLTHGGSLANQHLRKATEEKIFQFQSLAETLIAKATKIPPFQLGIYLGLPNMFLKIRRTGEGIQDFELIEPVHYKVNMGVTKIPEKYSKSGRFSAEVGVPIPIPVDPLMFPD